jgi:hypothetical protein
MRNRVPVAGRKVLFPVQISAGIRHLEAKRTREAARRASAPVLAADRGEFGAVKRQFRSEAASDRGVTNAVESNLAQALSGLGGSGLSGRYLQQTKRALTSQQGAVAAGLPFLLAGAKEERGEGLTKARQQLVSDRAQMQQSGAEAMNQRLKELREQGSSALKAQAGEAQNGGRSNSEIDSLKNASIALKNSLSNWAKNPIVKVNGEEIPAQQALPLKTGDDWRHFAEEMVHNSDGFGLNDAMTVIRHFLTQRKRTRPVRGAVAQVNPFG